MLHLQNIGVIFHDKSGSTSILDQLNLTLDGHDIVTIRGESGSGKTTLLRVIAGLLRPNQGQVLIDGLDLSALSKEKARLEAAKRVGFVWQDFKLIEEMTVRDNILLPLKIHKLALDKPFFQHLVTRLGLTNHLKKYPSQLSGGQKQRVALARALITKPSLVLADEPTGSLDVKTGQEVQKLLLDVYREFAQLLIIVTHDRDLASLGDRQFILEEGRLRAL